MPPARRRCGSQTSATTTRCAARCSSTALDEPHVDMSRDNVVASAGSAGRLAAALPIRPGRRRVPRGRARRAGVLITKATGGRSAVYRVPPHPSARRVQLLRRIGSIDLPPRTAGSCRPACRCSPPAPRCRRTARCSPSAPTPTPTCGTCGTAIWRRRSGTVPPASRSRSSRRARASVSTPGALVLDSEGRGQCGLSRAVAVGAASRGRAQRQHCAARRAHRPAVGTDRRLVRARRRPTSAYLVAVALVAVLGVGFAVWRRRGRE